MTSSRWLVHLPCRGHCYCHCPTGWYLEGARPHQAPLIIQMFGALYRATYTHQAAGSHVPYEATALVGRVGVPHTLVSLILVVVHQGEVHSLSRVQDALPGVGDGVVAAELQKMGESQIFGEN